MKRRSEMYMQTYTFPIHIGGVIPSLRKMELSFVIWIIVLGSGYIAFPVAKVFLAVFNKLNE